MKGGRRQSRRQRRRHSRRQQRQRQRQQKKQTGGSGQYAHIVGNLEPLPEDVPENFIFEDAVIGGRVPREYIPSVEKGFRSVLSKGPIAGFPIVGVKATLEDGSYHDVDSSDMAFQTCARAGFREAFLATKPVLMTNR
jgi:elongation factor G